MSWVASKWSSLSALQRSANIEPVIAVHSKSLDVLSKANMESENLDQTESLSRVSMSLLSSKSSLE